MTHASGAPGFYGKLPSHGDFIGRRLPPSVRHCLDAWLQRTLVQSRIDLGPAWLATWGSSPLWRFVIGAGVCGEEAWAGVMMPSADRVGRCFPLLLAAPADATGALRETLARYDAWYEQIEDLALSALESGFSLEAFDAALLATGGTPRVGGHGGITGASSAGQSDGQSAWWTTGTPLVAPCVATCDGMPSAAAFSALLDGRFAERGWSIETQFIHLTEGS